MQHSRHDRPAGGTQAVNLSQLAMPRKLVVLPDQVGSMLPDDKRPQSRRMIGGLHPGQRADDPF